MHHWQPSASFATLRERARILAAIRDFFAAKGVLEVETPLMCYTSVTDPFIGSIPVLYQHSSSEPYYLQTSPEYAMKRLLAAGSGPIYQICKAFRQAEVGQFHNPEFTMLEWYRPGFDHHALMDEMDELLQKLLNVKPAERMTYEQTFKTYLGIAPHEATAEQLAKIATEQGLNFADANTFDQDTWLQILASECIEPQLGQEKPFFIYHFPAAQSALARLLPTTPPVAARFEVYVKGIELANGFYELQDAKEQRRRFETNVEKRRALNLPLLPIDEKFLAALEHGLPDCAGVALGIDRLIMLATQNAPIQKVISFDIQRA